MSPRSRSPSKLLEINLLAAHDLPPVSKMLRTFAVAYVTPDHKLTTKIDHRGHTNPTWNYKMLFHVDRDFLKHESSALTIEIFNLAWLRDLPIGTARLHLNTLSPPLTEKPGYRRVSVQICRPTGHLQGTVSLGIQLVDMDDDISLSSLRISDEESVVPEKLYEEKPQSPEAKPGPEKKPEPGPEEEPGPEMIQPRNDESVCSTPESKYTWRPESEPETRTVTSGGSTVYSVMRSLPSEVAAGLKKGFYGGGASEYGSSVFENWTEGGDESDDLEGKTESGEWAVAGAGAGELVPLTSVMEIDCRRRPPENKNNGLFKCFSNIHAFEFTFVCGSNQFKLKKKMRHSNKVHHHRALSGGNLGKFYG